MHVHVSIIGQKNGITLRNVQRQLSLEESHHCTKLSSLSQIILLLTPPGTIHFFWIQFLYLFFSCCSKGNSLVL